VETWLVVQLNHPGAMVHRTIPFVVENVHSIGGRDWNLNNELTKSGNKSSNCCAYKDARRL
jgi:hypothetical protein